GLLKFVTTFRSLLSGRRKMLTTRSAHSSAVCAAGRTGPTGLGVELFLEPHPAVRTARQRKRRSARFITSMRRAPGANVRAGRARSHPRAASRLPERGRRSDSGRRFSSPPRSGRRRSEERRVGKEVGVSAGGGA